MIHAIYIIELEDIDKKMKSLVEGGSM